MHACIYTHKAQPLKTNGTIKMNDIQWDRRLIWKMYRNALSFACRGSKYALLFTQYMCRQLQNPSHMCHRLQQALERVTLLNLPKIVASVNYKHYLLQNLDTSFETLVAK